MAAASNPGRAPVLGARTRRIALALARVVMPQVGRIPAPDPAMLERVDDLLAAAPLSHRLGYVLVLWLVELGAVLHALRPLSRLAPERALAYLDALEHSPFGQLRLILRGAVVPLKACHFSDHQISRALGYDPPPPALSGPHESWLAQVHPGADLAGVTLNCDVVVVGSGPGGAVMATRLAERGLAVVILEEGRLHRRSEFGGRPLAALETMYRDAGLTMAFGMPGIAIPLGKTVGGTSTINSGTCFRAPPHVLAKWHRDLHLDAYSDAILGRHYEELEASLHIGPITEVQGGKVAEIIARGSDALGYSHHPLSRNADGCEGSGVCCFGCPTDAKRSMNVSYIPRALRAGAWLYTGARVQRILHGGGRARGVIAATDKGPLRVDAGAVVLSCGTILTPPLLMRNHLGGSSGHLGNHMTVHPAVKVAALFAEEVRGWEGVPQGHCIDEFEHAGIVFEGASLPPAMGAVGVPWRGARFMHLMERYDRVAFFGFLVEDEGHGRVRTLPFSRAPLVFYDIGAGELSRLRRGVEILCRVFFAAGAEAVLPSVAPVDLLTSVDDLRRLRDPPLRAQDFELTAFHPLGTCRAGVSAAAGVVDQGLELWDLDHLFVADGSVIPTSLAANPQLTIMALSSLASENVARRLDGGARWAS